MIPSTNERYFALQWWKSLSEWTKQQLVGLYKPEWSVDAVSRSTSTIVKIYREENK